MRLAEQTPAPAATGSPAPAEPGLRRRWSPWVLAALAVVAGLGLGRFVTAGEDDRPAAPESAASLADGSPEGRIAALEAAVAADPRDADSWLSLANAYTELGARSQDPDPIASASEALDRAAALAGDDPRIAVARGVLALTNHQFADALALGEEATDRLPANGDALGVLVDAQVELGRYDAAAETLQRLLDVRPGLPALARTSYLRELAGDSEAAMDAMRQAAVAGSSPYDIAAVTALLGDLHRETGDLDAAADAYARALDGAPDLVTARAGAAWVRAAQGDVDGAVASVQSLVDELPSPSLLLLLHDLQASSGDDEGAADTAELIRALASLQEAGGQVVDLEMALFEADVAEDPSRAVALARQAQAARPDNVFVDDAMAWALFRAGDTDAAVPFIEEALRLGTTEPSMRYHAAEILTAAGRTDEATEHLTVALRDQWFSFQHRERALELAEELGVAVAASA